MNEDNNSKRRKTETLSRPYFESRTAPRPECPHIPSKAPQLTQPCLQECGHRRGPPQPDLLPGPGLLWLRFLNNKKKQRSEMSVGPRIYILRLEGHCPGHAPFCFCLLTKPTGRGALWFGWVPSILLPSPKGSPPFTHGSTAKRKGCMEDLDTSQAFHAKQLT